MIMTAFVLVGLWAAPAPPPTMVYWLAECSGWPLSRAQLTDDGLQVQAVHARPGRVSARLRHQATGRRAHLVAHWLGSREAGWSVWSIRGPDSLRQLMAMATQVCRLVATYAQAWQQLGTTARAWLSERSTCYGQAIWRARAYIAWPCWWSTEKAGQGTVIDLAGVGPGILAGGNGHRSAGLN